LRPDAGGLTFTLIEAYWLGLRLPRRLQPRLRASESVEDGQYRFDVDIALPLIGRLIEYHGRLAIEPSAPGLQAGFLPRARHVVAPGANVSRRDESFPATGFGAIG
jgi:hypothetical protein